jgi:nicotinamide-nucleotide amidase
LSFDPETLDLAREVLAHCRERGWRLATAESCTGGLAAGALTEIAGSSDVVDRGAVTYSNAAKTAMLGVPQAMIAEHGAVSEPVARAMAEGAVRAADVELTVAITGVAGPGGTAAKPVGLVHFATAVKGGPTAAHVEHFGDLGRSEVRARAVATALSLLLARLT